MILLLLGLALAIYLVRFYWKRRQYPPGPFPLPLAGNLLQFYKNDSEWFEKLNKQFGPIYTFYLGPYPAVLINDLDVLKETFVKDGDNYTEKYTVSSIVQEFRGGSYGIIDTNGDRWRTHRRFALHQFRDLGLGKMKMEEKILKEVEVFCDRVEAHAAEDIHDIIRRAVGSVINQLLFGYRFYGEKEQEFDYLLKLLKEQQELGKNPLLFLVFFYKWTRYLPILKSSWKTFIKFRDEFFGFLYKQIDAHKAEIDFDSEDSGDYVEAYLKEQKKREDEGDAESFPTIQLANMCSDLWGAGLETTSSTLAWGIAYLVNKPEVQDKMFAEMEAAVGIHEEIRMAHKNELQYTQAVVNECQRVVNLVPINFPRILQKDVNLNGFEIKKGTGVVAQISTLLYDPVVFPEPTEFRPERFLDEEGNLKKIENFLPFSLGKRACPGEGLARMELFLFIANFIHRFKIEAIGEPPSLKRTLKNIQKPDLFKYKVTRRS